MPHTVKYLTLTTTDSIRAAVRLGVKFADLTDDRKDTLQTMLVRARKNIAAQIKLIARDTLNGVTNELAHAALGILRGGGGGGT